MQYVGGVIIDAYNKFKNLKEYIKNLGSVAIAFSGGVDSTFLAKVCKDVLNNDALAITVVSPIFPKIESEEAVKLAETIGIRHVTLKYEILSVKGFIQNPVDRCYICKSNLFHMIKSFAEEKNLKYVIDGTNADDTKDYRPGRMALKELGILSPLLEMGITKDEVRKLSKDLGLSTWDKPSYACLASRIPYGEEINIKKLETIEQAEDFLFNMGFDGLRVRYHKNIARIELKEEQMAKVFNFEIRNQIVKKFKELGFKYVTLDLEGYRMGSLNEPHMGLIKDE